MFNWLARKKISPITVAPGDSIQLTYTDKHGTQEVVTRKFDEAMTVDVIAIATFKDELGFKHGVIGVFAKE